MEEEVRGVRAALLRERAEATERLAAQRTALAREHDAEIARVRHELADEAHEAASAECGARMHSELEAQLRSALEAQIRSEIEAESARWRWQRESSDGVLPDVASTTGPLP